MTTEQLALDVRTPSGRKSRANTGMTEAQLLAAVRKLAHYRGWMTFHPHWSKGSEAGWPDLVLCHRRHRRVLVVELKVEAGQPTADQIEWLDALAVCGFEVGLWRPADLSRTIPAILGGAPMPSWQSGAGAERAVPATPNTRRQAMEVAFPGGPFEPSPSATVDREPRCR